MIRINLLPAREARRRVELRHQVQAALVAVLYLQRSQFELLKNPCVIYDGASQYSVEQKG